MPTGTLVGNIATTTQSRCEIKIGAVQGNVELTDGMHVDISQLAGNIDIGDSSTNAASLNVKDYVSGTFTETGALGEPSIYIEHDLVGVVPTAKTNYTPYGRVGAISYPTSPVTAGEIRDELETLTGDDRLDASAVKNIPTSSSPSPIIKSVVLNGTGQLVELVKFDDSTGNANFTRRDLDFQFVIRDSSDNLILLCKLTVLAEVGRQNTLLKIKDYISNFPVETVSEFRVTYDTSDPAGGLKVTYLSGLNGTFDFSVLNLSNRDYGNDVTFGGLTVLTPTGNEVTSSMLDTYPWQASNIIEGAAGGIASHTTGDVSNSGSYIDYRNSELQMVINNNAIGRFSSHGSRLSAGEYGSWIAPTSTDWPIDALFWTNLISQKRTETDDVTLNPSSTITLSAVDAGGTNAATMTGFDAAHRGLRFTTTTGTRGIAITFAGCLFQRVQFFMHFGTATSSGGATQDYEIVDADGNQLMSFDIPSNNNEPGDVNNFTFEFTSGSGDTVVYLRKRSTGTSQTVYLFNYGMTVNVDEPDLEPNVVVQQDSPLRGTMLPRILPSSSINHPRGSMALNGLAGNRPIWHDGNDWAYLNTTRISNTDVTGQFFFAQGNTFNESGWTGSNHDRLIPVQNHQGFPNLIRCTQSGGTITIQGPNNTQAMWDTFRAGGFRTDFRMMFGATFDGSVWVDVEPNNTSWGSTGRFEFNVTSNAGQLQITMINSGGNTTFDIDRDVMHTITMECEPNSDVASINFEGEKIGEVTYGGGGSTERGTFFYIPPGNPVNDFSFQSITTSGLDSNEFDVTLDANAIRTGLRHTVANIGASVTRRIPKGLYPEGSWINLINGSTKIALLKGEDDDKQLIGGLPELEVGPQKDVMVVQTGSPLGTNWSVQGGKTIINHQDNVSTGNSLILTVDSAGTVTGRHGTYLGDLTVTRTTTGQYSITAGSKVWGDEMTILATPFGTAAKEITSGVGGLGQAFVNTFDAAGNPLSDAFYAALYW